MTDLTERLRKRHEMSQWLTHHETYSIYGEAADRIEELEAQLKNAYEFIPNGYRCSMTDEPLGSWSKIL